MTDERTASRREWLIPAALILLSAIPVVAGALRLDELAGGIPAAANTAHFFATPLPLVLHIVGATLFCVLGAFQFPPAFRRRWPRWHRVWGHGYATEAGRALRDRGFETLPIDRLHVVVDPGNERSLAVARRLGFRHVEDTTRYYGRTLHHLELTRAEWERR